MLSQNPTWSEWNERCLRKQVSAKKHGVSTSINETSPAFALFGPTRRYWSLPGEASDVEIEFSNWKRRQLSRILQNEASCKRWRAVSPSREKRYRDLGIHVEFTHGSFLKNQYSVYRVVVDFYLFIFQDVYSFIRNLPEGIF